KIRGADDSDLTGQQLVFGDWNADGTQDLAVAAPNGSGQNNSRPQAGEGGIFYGAAGRPGAIDPGLRGAGAPHGKNLRVNGAPYYDQLGSALASGDLNGDGKEDLVITAHHADGPGNTRPDCGEVYIIFGQAVLASQIDLASSDTSTTNADVTIIGHTSSD